MSAFVIVPFIKISLDEEKRGNKWHNERISVNL